MRVLVLLIVLSPLVGLSQGTLGASDTKENLSYYLSLYSSAEDDREPDLTKVLEFADKLDVKRPTFKSEKLFLKHVFLKTHQQFLKHYVKEVSFGTTLNKGTYNCLTGTALYALLLDRFNIKHQVIETNYHIFIVVSTEDGRVLLETTDPQNGFVDGEQEIEKRIKTYRQNVMEQEKSDKSYYRFSYEVYREVNLDEMLGLLYYNLAITAYNDRQFETSISQLDKALALYQSPRIEEFSRIILLSVIESRLDAVAKEECIRRVQMMRKNKLMVAARATLH